MTLGNVVHSQSHLGHNVYRFDHCKEFFILYLPVSTGSLCAEILSFLIQLVDVLHSALVKDNTRNQSSL